MSPGWAAAGKKLREIPRHKETFVIAFSALCRAFRLIIRQRGEPQIHLAAASRTRRCIARQVNFDRMRRCRGGGGGVTAKL